jgi:tRNA modification GTPase
MNDIIVSLATPIGPGAIALIRISGKNIRSFLSSHCSLYSGKKIEEVSTHTINYGQFLSFDKKNIIDEVFFLIMDCPRTFTGEDIIEITCHNNIFIIQSIIEVCCKLGARPANRGEFSKRAFENKKIDILQAEAINELINSQSESAARASLSQLRGSLSNEIFKIDEKIAIINAFCQASFEFVDEEINIKDKIILKIKDVINDIVLILEKKEISDIVRNGIRISIIGSVNAGKSSLFNSLINKNRAIVTNIPGTTRDSIEYGFYRNGLYITLIDTAGIRQTDDIIEKEGIKKSYYEAESSDILIFLFEKENFTNNNFMAIAKELVFKFSEKIIFALNKIDLCKNNFDFLENNTFIKNNNFVKISTIKDQSINLIFSEIDKKIDIKTKNANLPYLINIRQFQILNYIKNQLHDLLNLLNTKSPYYEIIFQKICDIQANINEISGKSVSEKSIDKVFQEFCIGK